MDGNAEGPTAVFLDLHPGQPGAAHGRRRHRGHDRARPRQAAAAPGAGAARDGEEQGRRRIPVRRQRDHARPARAADRARRAGRFQLHRIHDRGPATCAASCSATRCASRAARDPTAACRSRSRAAPPSRACARCSIHPWRRRLAGSSRYTRRRHRAGRARADQPSNRRSRACRARCRRRCRRTRPRCCRCAWKCFPATAATGCRSRSGRRPAASCRPSSCAPRRPAAARPAPTPCRCNARSSRSTRSRARRSRIPERRGTTLRGSLPALDLDRWLPLLAEAPIGPAAEGVSYDLKVGVLDALGKRMRGATMQGITDSTGWSASMSTAEFAGDLVYRSEGSGRLVARMHALRAARGLAVREAGRGAQGPAGAGYRRRQFHAPRPQARARRGAGAARGARRPTGASRSWR